jgi:hypothetical protein
MRAGRVALALACGLALAAALPVPSAPAAEPVAITGTIAPAEEDDEGNVLSVQIETPDGPYRVQPTGKGAELRSQIGLSVTARGRISVDEAGGRRIEVLEYTLIED